MKNIHPSHPSLLDRFVRAKQFSRNRVHGFCSSLLFRSPTFSLLASFGCTSKLLSPSLPLSLLARSLLSVGNNSRFGLVKAAPHRLVLGAVLSISFWIMLFPAEKLRGIPNDQWEMGLICYTSSYQCYFWYTIVLSFLLMAAFRWEDRWQKLY